MMDGDRIEWEAVTAALQRLEIPMEGAELHGICCGHQVSARGTAGETWLAALIGEQDEANLLLREDVKLLGRLFRTLLEQLNDPGIGFQLLLPESAPLDQRAEGLARWCDGFLFGYGEALAGTDLGQSLHEQEFIEDLVEISHLVFEGEEGDQDELQFQELIEHLRLGTVLLYEENHPVMPAAGPDL